MEAGLVVELIQAGEAPNSTKNSARLRPVPPNSQQPAANSRNPTALSKAPPILAIAAEKGQKKS